MCPEQSSRHTRTHDKVSFCCRRRCVSRARTTAKAAQAGGRRIKNEMAISGRLSRPASLLFKSIFTAAGRKTRSLSLSVNPRLCPHAGEAAALTWPLSSCKNILPPSAGRSSFAHSLFSLAFADFAEIFTAASYHNHKILLRRCSWVRARARKLVQSVHV